MILNLKDGMETIFLALVLRSAAEGKPVPEILLQYVKKDRVLELAETIRIFSAEMLRHPDLVIASQELENLLVPKDQGKGEKPCRK